MKIIFEKIEIDNFLSIGHAEINLLNRGYTLITGVNNNPKDSAESNGSGKSTILSAISYALTGETLSGNKDVKNLFTEEGTLVTLYLTVDNHKYQIQRSKEHSIYKTDLKILIDDIDKSGKGIRDSQKILEQYLPDITTQFIGSVILLGQGMPQRFTNNTPSGRKEILENLSKSDFMIEDLKNRISNRKFTLTEELRANENEETKLQTQIEMLNSRIDLDESRLNDLGDGNSIKRKSDSIRESIFSLQRLLSDKKGTLEHLSNEWVMRTDDRSALENQLQQIKAELLKVITDRKNALITKLSNAKIEKQTKAVEIQSNIDSLSKDITIKHASINQLESISDICPTCGRKLDNVVKPDTTVLHQELDKLIDNREEFIKSKEKLILEYDLEIKSIENDLQQIEAEYQFKDTAETSEIRLKLDSQTIEIKNLDIKLNELKSEITELENQISNNNIELAKSDADLVNFENTIKNLKAEIKSNTDLVIQTQEKLENIILNRDNLEKRLGIINKFNTIITRDFRGYILSNVIEYIDKKAKDYCEDVFGNRNIEFALNGNNLDIKFCDKIYESLSGGESQKINIIVQFALRDMLCQFLDFRCNLIGIDECFDFLDSVGCDKIIELISKRLTDIDTIFIISHHKELGIPSDSTIIVTKNEFGISSVRDTL